MEKTAISFYKEIETEKDKYRLVNGLFIIKYLDEEVSHYIGEFLKSENALNQKKKSIVIIDPNTNLKYNKKKNICTTALGGIRELSIRFDEKPIEEILKC